MPLPWPLRFHPRHGSVLPLPCVCVPCTSLLDWARVGGRVHRARVGGQRESSEAASADRDEPQEERETQP